MLKDAETGIGMGYTTFNNGSNGPKRSYTPLTVQAFVGEKVRVCLDDAPLSSPHAPDTALPRLEKALREFGLIAGKNYVSYTDNGKIYVAVKDVKPPLLFKYLGTCGFRPHVPDVLDGKFLDDRTFEQLAHAQRPVTFQERVPSAQAGVIFATHQNSLATR